MANPSQSSPNHKPPVEINWLNFRTLAVLLMIAGAFGFVVSLLAFDGQVLCLFASTVIVFIGLGVNIKFKNTQRVPQEGRNAGTPSNQSRGSIAARRSWSTKPSPAQTPAPFSWTQENSGEDNLSTGQSQTSPTFDVQTDQVCRQVIEFFRQQGAFIQIDTKREGRCILYIQSQAGKHFSVIVQEGKRIIDVVDLRALYAVVESTGAEGGIMVSPDTFTEQAVDWAEKKSIQLITSSALDKIILS